ncbi:alpha-amylase [Cladophialophora psammophila CBS 110553]|uniref:Alpha-amylase n=1 Tax=Cladophialophora psammophila CBS 110553 TaxID=1182543 RepID=W9WYS4_9EURO|nr:alpha-amylase [Cladophialophora psammophila CBS 110553]EXJ69826.1 alpha-amylase [Cladophialophora psammophila CBS 110553]
MSNAEPKTKRMAVGEEHAGEIWTDLLGWQQDAVQIDDESFEEFMCLGTSVSVWINKEVEGRDQVDMLDCDSDIYAKIQ